MKTGTNKGGRLVIRTKMAARRRALEQRLSVSERVLLCFSGDASSRLHTHTHTHTEAPFKRGYIKQVSDLDDSLDVGSWERVMCAGGGELSSL